VQICDVFDINDGCLTMVRAQHIFRNAISTDNVACLYTNFLIVCIVIITKLNMGLFVATRARKKKQREPSLFAGVGVDVGAGCHAGEASLVTTQERNKLTKQSEVT